MIRSKFIGATLGGLLAGASLTALALAAPSWANDEPVSPVTVASAGQTTNWGLTPNLADLVETVSPSVVQIIVRSQAQPRPTQGPGGIPNELRGTPFEEFFNRQFGEGGPQRERPDQMGSGSGFFIGPNYIVTNNHVVDNARKVTVVLSDGKEIEASVVGTDAKTDIAVLKVSQSGLPPALSWGDSDKARAGDSVFAVGSPFGLGNTVTSGIVSARGRDIRSGPYDDYIQVDAPINMGNSGGPLFNTQGQVIGVNTAIFSPSGGSVGIGFSIPADMARSIVQQIIDTGSVRRGWLGVQIQPVTPDMAKGLGVAARGAIVADVTASSPAAKAGFKTGDIILSFGETSVDEVHDLTRAVADTQAGSSRDVKVLRNGREQTIKVRIEALEEEDAAPRSLANAAPSAPAGPTVQLSGLGLELTNDGGPVVSDVTVNGPAADVGLRSGDRLVMVNQVEVNSAEAARRAVDEARKQKREAVMLQVERDGAKLFVGVPFSAG
ncbi:MAG: Do family serine endopeptidase [Alphaproteobacteria bacterium]|nr:Do family serine endopeptidase [Alphaproteobacteria bacterium]